MGKKLDDRECEFAYVDDTNIKWHQIEYVDKESEEDTGIRYYHLVNLSYERKEANGKHIGFSPGKEPHRTELMMAYESVDEAKERVAAAMWEWVRMDKIHLSGYDIGEDPNQS